MLSRTRSSGALIALLLAFTLPTFSQTPTFRTETYPAAAGSTDAVRTDLNEDGALDFVIVGTGGGPCTTCIILSNGDGSYRPPVAYNDLGFHVLATGDLNGDGNADVVFTGLSIAYGNGDGTLKPLVRLSNASAAAATRAAVADFNKDGRQDIAVMTQEFPAGASPRNRLFVLVNNGNGSFTTQGPYATETFWHDELTGTDAPWTVMKLEVGDFDADGRADVTYTLGAKTDESGPAPNHSKLVALFNNGGGALTTTRVVKDADRFLQGVVGDMNQDGRADLVSQNFVCDSTGCAMGIDVFYGSTARTFTERFSPTTGGAYGYPQIADFNGDHRQDVAMVTSNFATDTFGVIVFTQNADGSFTAQAPYPLGSYVSCRACGPPAFYLFAGDFNRDRKPDLATVGGDESVLRVALNTTSASGFPGCLHPGGRGINVCSPASGSTVQSPVPFSIGVSDFKGVRKVEVWVDGQKQKETFFSFADYSYFDADLVLTTGSHNVSVYAAGFDNMLQKKSFTFIAGSGGGTCGPPASPTGTVICQPMSGQTYGSPVPVQARGGANVTFMEVWVDGTKRFQTSGNSVSTSLTLANGSHKLTVYSKNGSTVLSSAVSNFSIDPSGCAQPSSPTATVICAPPNGSTRGNPIHVLARGGSSVKFMEVWIDGTKRFQTSGNTVDTPMTLTAGSHKLTVFSKNGSMVLSNAVSNFTVQ